MLNLTPKDLIHQLRLDCQIPNILSAIASRKIIVSTAASCGIAVEPEEIQQAADNLRVAKKLVKASDTLEWLKKHHLSINEFEELVQTNILAAKLAHHLFAKQVETFFFAHQIDYVAAVTYEVVLDNYNLALELFYALQEGEISFPEIARQYIQIPELRHMWGYQGIRRRVDFHPEIAAAVFACTAPQMLKPIAISSWVYLIWVEEIIHPKLDKQLREKIQQDLFAAWLKQQIEQLEIAIQIDDSNIELSQSPVPSYTM